MLCAAPPASAALSYPRPLQILGASHSVPALASPIVHLLFIAGRCSLPAAPGHGSAVVADEQAYRSQLSAAGCERSGCMSHHRSDTSSSMSLSHSEHLSRALSLPLSLSSLSCVRVCLSLSLSLAVARCALVCGVSPLSQSVGGSAIRLASAWRRTQDQCTVFRNAYEGREGDAAADQQARRDWHVHRLGHVPRARLWPSGCRTCRCSGRSR
jgi:hypothetical protein